MDLTDELSVATEAAVRAGALLADYFSSGEFGTRSKSRRQDVVTDADTASEQLLVEALLGQWPDDAVLAEESGSHRGVSGRQWCIDPLDGTANFASGVPHWAVAISLLEAGRAILAVTYDPSRDELFTATRQTGARLDGWDLRVAEAEGMEDALLAMNLPYAARMDASLAAVLHQGRGLRESGSMALDLAWVAAGRLHLAAHEQNDHLWDYLGGEFLVECAGGVTAPLEGYAGLALVGHPAVVDDVRNTLERSAR